MAANIRFYTENIFDSPSTISVGTEDSDYPVENIQHCHRSKRWHSEDLEYYVDELDDKYEDELGGYYQAEIEIRFDVGSGGQVAGYVAIVNPNVTSGNLIIKATDNSDYSNDLKLNETFSVVPKVFGYGQDRYGKHGYGGTLLASEMERYTPGGRVVLHHFDVGIIGARYWSLVIPTSCAKEDAYYAIGRIFAGTWYEPTYNMSYGYTLFPIDSTKINVSAGGQPWLDIGPKKRAMEFDIPIIKTVEARFDMFDLFQEYGKRNDIIVCAFPEGTEEEKMFDTIYGRFVDPSGISGILPNFYRTSKTVRFVESL